jgi:hypothetical protein
MLNFLNLSTGLCTLSLQAVLSRKSDDFTTGAELFDLATDAHIILQPLGIDEGQMSGKPGSGLTNNSRLNQKD